MQTTIFDKILKKEIPANVVYEDEWVLAFRDVSPQAPTHILVIPKKKVTGFASFADSTPLEVGEFISRVARVAKQCNLEGTGYRIVFNHGQDAQQSVEYVHAHILGGRELKWPPG